MARVCLPIHFFYFCLLAAFCPSHFTLPSSPSQMLPTYDDFVFFFFFLFSFMSGLTIVIHIIQNWQKYPRVPCVKTSKIVVNLHNHHHFSKLFHSPISIPTSKNGRALAIRPLHIAHPPVCVLRFPFTTHNRQLRKKHNHCPTLVNDQINYESCWSIAESSSAIARVHSSIIEKFGWVTLPPRSDRGVSPA